jgi:hypothetical protein
MALALIGQAAGTIERDHVARVTRGATSRAHRLEADCHGTGEAADITAPAVVAADDGRVPATPAASASARGGSTVASTSDLSGLAPQGTFVWLPLLPPGSLTSQAPAVGIRGRAPPAV